VIYSCALFDCADDLASSQIPQLASLYRGAGASKNKGAAQRALYRVRLGLVAAAPRQARRRVKASRPADPQPLPGVLDSSATRGPTQRFREENWRNHRPDDPMTRSISIGAFEHFRPSRGMGIGRTRAYREFFAWSMGSRAGRASVAPSIAYPDPPSDPVRANRLIAQMIFPEASAADLGSCRRGRRIFERCALRNDRAYFRTRPIVAQSDGQAGEAVPCGEAEVADFRRYLREPRGLQLGVVCPAADERRKRG